MIEITYQMSRFHKIVPYMYIDINSQNAIILEQEQCQGTLPDKPAYRSGLNRATHSKINIIKSISLKFRRQVHS